MVNDAGTANRLDGAIDGEGNANGVDPDVDGVGIGNDVKGEFPIIGVCMMLLDGNGGVIIGDVNVGKTADMGNVNAGVAGIPIGVGVILACNLDVDR